MTGYVGGSGWPLPGGLVAVQRRHLYEGYNGDEHIIELYRQGVDRVLLTASVGGVMSPVGHIAPIKDLITLFYGPSEGFVDMSQPLHSHGVTHAFVPGARLETRADVAALTRLGADVVGMSITPEVVTARSLGMKVKALCLVTNYAGRPHDHEKTLKAAEDRREELLQAIEEICLTSW